MIVPYRQRETIYVVPEKERVAAIISVNFADPTDRAIARVFMMVRPAPTRTPRPPRPRPAHPVARAPDQEFVDVQRLTSNAPPVFFGREPPTELRGMETREDLADESHVGYISFGAPGTPPPACARLGSCARLRRRVSRPRGRRPEAGQGGRHAYRPQIILAVPHQGLEELPAHPHAPVHCQHAAGYAPRGLGPPLRLAPSPWSAPQCSTALSRTRSMARRGRRLHRGRPLSGADGAARPRQR